MKKIVRIIVVVVVFGISFVSCSKELAEDETLIETAASEGDEEKKMTNPKINRTNEISNYIKIHFGIFVTRLCTYNSFAYPLTGFFLN